MIDGHYRFVSRHMLWICAAEFYLTNTPARAALVHSMLNVYLARSLEKALDEYPHDMLISTHPFYSYEVMQALKKHSSHVPFGIFFADTKVHCSWLHEKHAAATFAMTRESYQQALDAGFDRSRLHLVGWLVRRQFYHASELSRAETRSRLNLDPSRFTVFLQGGAEGAARVERTLENILAASQDVQVILATGRNQALLEYFTGKKSVRALPFTPEIAPYMAAADVIMGKAGANIIFESMTLGKPFIATSYIPAQEKANLEFIQQHGLGWVALEPEKLRELIVMLATSSTELILMSEKIQAYRRWNRAANESIAAILRTLMPVEKFA
jgi:UDP-N-acetylglucosamine:LPS N-acetylglucosamine transferase